MESLYPWYLAFNSNELFLCKLFQNNIHLIGPQMSNGKSELSHRYIFYVLILLPSRVSRLRPLDHAVLSWQHQVLQEIVNLDQGQWRWFCEAHATFMESQLFSASAVLWLMDWKLGLKGNQMNVVPPGSQRHPKLGY